MVRTVSTSTFEDGEVVIRVHEIDNHTFVVADQAGWLSGEFDTAELALSHGKEANHIP